MNSEEHNDSAERYVLGIMSPDERTDYERLLQTERAMQGELEKARAFHRGMLALGRTARIDERDLEDQIIAQLPELRRYEHRPSRFATVLKGPWFYPVLLAACLVLSLFCGRWMLADPIRWRTPVVMASVVRGESDTVASREELMYAARDLQLAIGASYKSKHPQAQRNEWELEMNVRGLLHGAVRFEIGIQKSALGKAEPAWERTFETVGDYRMQKNAWADEIASALAEQMKNGSRTKIDP